jgi:hypothetical protein
VASIDSKESLPGQGRDAHVLQGDDARQVGHVGREGAHVVVAARHADGDGQFGVVVLDLDLAGAEQLELQAAAQAGLVDVGQQRVHLGLARQLLFELGHVLLHLQLLLAQLAQVDRLRQPVAVGFLERGFLLARTACSSSSASKQQEPAATTTAAGRQPGRGLGQQRAIGRVRWD